MLSPEARNGRIRSVETRLSREEYSIQQLKRTIQTVINESESDPREIEIVGENETWSLLIPYTTFSLVNALPPRYKETHSRFSNFVDSLLENADYMIIRAVR